jgi:hypothetical protein
MKPRPRGCWSSNLRERRKSRKNVDGLPFELAFASALDALGRRNIEDSDVPSNRSVIEKDGL